MRFAFERQNAVTLGNNTNNRIEASWKQLKDLVNSFMGVDECIAAIMGYQDQEEKKFIDALHKLTVVHNPKYYCEIQFLSRLVSEHDCELVCEQFDFALTYRKYKYCEAVPDVILIQNNVFDEETVDEPCTEHPVNKRDWTCSCLFKSSTRLPCRHVFYLRKQWSSRTLFLPNCCIQETHAICDSNRKYREASAVANGIREQLSDLGIKEYKAALRALRDVATLFRHGEFDAVSSVTRQLEETSDHDNPNQPNMEPHASSPQPGMDDHSLGTIGRELGADCNGLSTQGNRLGNDGTRLGTGETQVAQTSSQTRPTLAENQPQSEGELHLTGENQAHAVNLEDSNDAFEIQSPPRSRGRPGQKPRAV
ncbi:Zinc finger, SWIM-type [Phytophthora cactorum]|nr:Zinc finger, SWIM-type [Phytophthora cactorum]